ncbi:uncharacterized protein LOC103955988 [Pyrus x bretschneideri]|uniref:uncharacterized protein LOC103955988 n=1 Tax=Pyrus x bretschneideri TaxID=225117 RepID=UPI00202FE720|nr:uncharacterized protein LOC103955988 [Pyrus x bretschneideri]
MSTPKPPSLCTSSPEKIESEKTAKECKSSASLISLFSSNLTFSRLDQRRAIPAEVRRLSGPTSIRSRGPTRRSSRLKNATPVSYAEVHVLKKDEASYMKGITLEEGDRPEIYTQEHETLLGNTDKTWTLFVDGYGKDGKRIYDPVRGKTCHQCRQKTLGHHTQCNQCNRLQGQFCGDCLYMRYGEHVIEANQNPDWICPVCRGICNCSFCRTKKGWPPTGILYKKVSQLGFKSVAHYLIHTQQGQTNSGENLETTNQVSAKRSLQFPDVDASCEEIVKDDNDIGAIKLLTWQERDDEFKSEKENDIKNSTNLDINNQTSAERGLSFSDVVQQPESFGSPEVDHKVGDHLGLSKLQSETESSRDDRQGGKENTMPLMDMKLGSSNNALETSSKSEMKPALDIEPSTDSIGGRLRQRRRKGNELKDDDLQEEKMEIPDSSPALGTGSKLNKKRVLAEPSPDSIGGRLRQRRKGNA